jgi:hypothetical protein
VPSLPSGKMLWHRSALQSHPAEDTVMTNAWKIGTFALVALVAVVALGLNGRARSNNLPSDDAEMYPQFCSVVGPVSPCFQGYGGLFIWDPH